MFQDQPTLIDEVLTDMQVAQALGGWLERNRPGCASVQGIQGSKVALDIQIHMAPNAIRVVVRRKDA